MCSALKHVRKRLFFFHWEFSEKFIFGDGANSLNTPLLENIAVANNILDASAPLLPVYVSLAVETDRLMYVFNNFVVGECQQMPTQEVATCTRVWPVSISMMHTATHRTLRMSV